MSDQLIEQLLDTWAIHNRITRFVLAAISDDALAGVSASGGRSVREQYAHLHNVRLMWIEAAKPELMAGLQKIPTKTKAEKDAITRAVIESSLSASEAAIAEMLREGLKTGRIKGFKPHPVAFLGYLIAHESYHWGEIGIILTQAGTPLDQKTAYGMWEWGVR